MSREPPPTVEALLGRPLRYLRLEWDAGLRAITLRMRIRPVPCYSLAVMGEIAVVTDFINAHPGEMRHLLLLSDLPGVFNFGGDLALFVLLCRARDLDSLRFYGRRCIELVWWVHTAPLKGVYTTVVLQGDALGGGLESALPAQRLIVERSAQAGFPEILFNLFPGMGAWHFLSRRAGHAVAQEMVLSGKLYDGDALKAMGVADAVVPDGAGETAARAAMRALEPRFRGTLLALRAAADAVPASLEGLQRVVDAWAEAALHLTDRDLRLMERLVRAQLKKAGGGQEGAIEEIKRLELEEALGAAAPRRGDP